MTILIGLMGLYVAAQVGGEWIGGIPGLIVFLLLTFITAVVLTAFRELTK